jgi:hypothetical protein
MSLRFRILAHPPLPSLRSWHVVSTDAHNFQPTTIYGLKEVLLNEFPALRQSCPNASSQDLVLMIDGFELLDNTSLRVIRDDDLVT